MGDYNSTHTGNVIDAVISAVIAGQAGIQGVKVNGTELTPDSSNKVNVPVPEVVQTTGTSTTTVMSQKAVTDAIGSSTSGIAGVKVNGVELTKDSANKVDVPVPVMQSSTGSSTSDGMTQAAITTALGGKVDTTSIVQSTGTSTTSVMSQNAVSEELDLKVDKETGKGLSTNDYTTTEKTKLSGIEAEANKTTVVQTTGESTTSVMSQKAVTDAIGSSTSGIAGVKVNGVELEKDAANKVDVPVPVMLGSTGSSTTDGMNQKSITVALDGKIDTTAIVQSIGTSTTSVMSQNAVSEELDLKVDKETGKGLSTNDYTTAEKEKLANIEEEANKTVVVQTTGESTTSVMSQKAVTDAIGSSTSGIAGVKVNGVELEKDAANKVDVPVPVMLGSTGSSTTDGMNQKSITVALDGKIDTTAIVQSIGTSTTSVMSQKAVSDAISDVTVEVVQNTGTSTTSVMSQSAVTSNLNFKVDKETGKGLSTNDYTTVEKNKLELIEHEATKNVVVQTTGESTTSVMSQKVVSELLGTKVSLSSYVATLTSGGWSGTVAPYTQNVTVYGVLSTDTSFVDLTDVTVSKLADWGSISQIVVNDNSITATCLESKPNNDLSIQLKCFRQ